MTDPARAGLLAHLSSRGFVVGASGGWWRASATEERLVVDVAGHPVVNPRTFESISLPGPPVELKSSPLRLANPNDLARMKLVAMRDQDFVDLVVLANATFRR